MKRRAVISLIFVLALVLGISWGYMNGNAIAKEITVDCCSQCVDYCKCKNGTGDQTGCYTVACEAVGSCSGIGIKCCWPE